MTGPQEPGTYPRSTARDRENARLRRQQAEEDPGPAP